MKILNIEHKDGMIFVETNNASRPMFVYRDSLFDNLASLEKEINKSRMNEARKYAKELTKKHKLKLEFDDRKRVKELLEMNAHA